MDLGVDFIINYKLLYAIIILVCKNSINTKNKPYYKRGK